MTDLKVLTAGPLPPNPADLLGSQRMIDLIESLCNQADVVILDASPLLPVTDSQALAALVDGVLLVVRAGYTRRVLVQRSRQVLKDIGVKVLGVVLNRSAERNAGYGNYYDYADNEEPHASSSFRVGSIAQLLKRVGRAIRVPRAILPASKVADRRQSDQAKIADH